MFACSFTINTLNILVFQESSYYGKQEASRGRNFRDSFSPVVFKRIWVQVRFRKLSDYWCCLIRSGSLPENIERNVRCCYRKL